MKLRSRNFGSLVLRGLTPLLDTLFILLFALLALSDTRQVEPEEEVRIELPSVEPGGEAAPVPAERVSIFVDADSVVRLETSTGEPELIESFEALDAALAAGLGTALPEDVAVDLVADTDARHGVMVELLQHLRLRGFTHVQLLATGGEAGETFGRGDAR